MVGTERTVTPLVGSEQFHLGAIAISFFVVVSGFTKATTNADGGAVTGRYTRKSILVAGWLIGLPVPFMLAWAFMRETHPRPAADSGPARATAGEAARRVNGGMT